MSDSFESRLGRVLRKDFNIQEMTTLSGGPDPQQFLHFLNAVVTSSDHARTEQALARAAAMPPEELMKHVVNVDSLGNLSGLSDYIKSKPSRIMGLIEIARVLFQGVELEEVVDQMIRGAQENEVYDEEGDFYYDQGDDSDGH